MNIKEFFSSWMGSDFESDRRAQSICADIEEAVLERIAELEEHLESYRHANGSKAARIQKMKEQHEESARLWKQYIAELKEQLPKVVTPVFMEEVGAHRCACYNILPNKEWEYCHSCGAKLNWEEA